MTPDGIARCVYCGRSKCSTCESQVLDLLVGHDLQGQITADRLGTVDSRESRMSRVSPRYRRSSLATHIV